MLTKEKFISYLKDPSSMDESTLLGLKQLIEDFPYFPVARMLYLRNLKNIKSYRFETELQEHAIFIPDRKKLYIYLNADPAEKQEQMELLPLDNSVFDSVIDVSLPEYNLETSDGNDTTEHFTADNQKDEPVDLIDKFIQSNPKIEKVGRKKPTKKPEEQTTNKAEEVSLISETLAVIYEKQGHYEKAIDAYHKLSLKIPEKSVYFAARIEELKKLMLKT